MNTQDATLLYVRAERPSAVYQSGEKIRFTVKGDPSGYVYTVHDGKNTTVPAALTPDGIVFTARTPGFLLVKIWAPEGRQHTTYAGVAIEPEKISCAAVCPDDFDLFWDSELQQLQTAPLEILKETSVPTDLLPSGISACDVQVRRNGITATGFLAWPSGVENKLCPGVLTFPGADNVSAELPVAVQWARCGTVCFNLNFHGFPNSTLPRCRFSETSLCRDLRKKTYRYQYQNANDRRKYAMREIFLRDVIAADYLIQRPEFNGKTLVSLGGSMGGCQSLVCASLVPQVTRCVSQATAMCDHTGEKAGHLPGWPGLLAQVPDAEQTSGYFDVSNFVHRVKCPVFMAVGFIDTVCPPASTYAVFNRLKSPGKMAHSVTGGHSDECLDPQDTGVFQLWNQGIAEYLQNIKE